MSKGRASDESQAATTCATSAAPRDGVAVSEPLPVSTGEMTRHSFAPHPFVRYHLVPRNWWMVSPMLLVLLAIAGLSVSSLPPLETIELALVAVAIPLISRTIVKLERSAERGGVARFAIMLLVVAVPLLCFGCALSLWDESASSGAWNKLLSVGVTTSVTISILLTGRLPSLLACQVGLWTGIAASDGSHASVGLLLLGFATSVFLAYYYSRQQKAAGAHHRKREHAQFRAEEFLAEYENSGQGWFWETDAEGAISYVSPIIGRTLSKRSEELLGRPFVELFRRQATGQLSQCALTFHFAARSSFQELVVKAAKLDEEKLWSINGRPVYDRHDIFLGFRGSGSDLTERGRSHQHTSRLAHYDSLTGLANRFQMSQTLETILTAPLDEHRACAVFLIDLDRFKQVNDTLGHPAGDALLKLVAQRLVAVIGNLGRIGRLGGDEFQVIMPGRIAHGELADLAQQIIASLSQPYSVEGTRATIGASLGIAQAPLDGVTVEAIIRNADMALYAAKDAGKGCHHFYAPELHNDAEERRQLETDLHDAVTRGGIELHYQPVVQTATERIVGFEALLRWNHPTRGAISPARFIPIAEDAGLIAKIGEWALRTACHDLGTWPEHIRVAVNVSALQFANPALPGIVTNALASAGVDPARLELEITESVFLNDGGGTEAMFATLKRIGVRLALDDFGTGYSSLGYLKKAPFDVIKIDQAFVRGATVAGSRNGAIIASIVSLAEALGMATTAEGVETAEELDLVRMLGCSHVQGYIYEKPLRAADARQRLADGVTAVALPLVAGDAVRRPVSRRVRLRLGGEEHEATIRNISSIGALIEGLWDIPKGTSVDVVLAPGQVLSGTARWSRGDLTGVEFTAEAVVDDAEGTVSSPVGLASPARATSLRQTG
jgi:diguanylate cyclase (GGDEF)-like protein